MIKKQMLFLGLMLLLVCACESKSNENKLPIVKEKTSNQNETVLFSFSLFKPLDMIVSQGSYQLAYRNGRLLDTVFASNGPVFLGTDSLLYIKIKKSNESEVEGMYSADFVGLCLADRERVKKVDLPLFNLYFSTFITKEHTIYYYGFDNGKLFACSFDFDSNKFKKRYLGEEIETDFFGCYDNPNN